MDKYTVIDGIERIAPPTAAAAWDRSGIQVPCLRGNVFHLGVALDPTIMTIRKALDAGVDMLLTHHPLTLSPRFTDTEDSYLGALRLLLQSDMMLYSAHTSLDANPHGPAFWLPAALQMTDADILEPTGTVDDARTGIGVVGDIAPTSLDHIISLIDCPYPRLVGACPAELSRITRVAVCPGSGAQLMHAAKHYGAQLFITGDMKYHMALEAVLPILDVGHFSLEERMTRGFADQLRHDLPDMSVTFIASEDPFMTLCK